MLWSQKAIGKLLDSDNWDSTFQLWQEEIRRSLSKVVLSWASMSEANLSDTPTGASVPSFDTELQDMLLKAVRGGAKITDAHLKIVQNDIEVAATKTRVHCYAPTLDANGRLRTKRLAEFLRDRVIEYAIPRKTLEKAQEHLNETGSPAEIIKLHELAKRLFTDLKNTGEGGEFLLFALAEAVFQFTQILCKMSLKTSKAMHYHGADGVYASGDDEGYLNIYWGESKLYGDATSAITDCLKSLAPFLRDEPSTEAASAQDLFLANEFADFSDPKLITALKRFFDNDDTKSNKLRLCGVALVGFDCEGFPSDGESGEWATVETGLNAGLPKWRAHIEKRIGKEALGTFDIHFICVPMRSVDEFRQAFLKLLEAT